MSTPTIAIAIAHDYLTQRGGAERVVLALARAFPQAVVHTTLYDAASTYPEFADLDIVTSPLNRVAALRKDHRRALPLLPWAASRLVVDADIVIASSSGWAHGFPTRGRRIVYCHSPARWLYQTDTYLGRAWHKDPRGIALQTMRPLLRQWDVRAASGADTYLANSRVVRERIGATYGIDADVVPAPHSVDPSARQDPVAALADWSHGFHLVVSRLLPYKNVDKAVAAFRGLEERLVIVGDGPQRGELAASLPANVRLLSGLSDAEMRWVYAHCEALLAPSIEDFGLTPLEAGAYGRPVATLRGGGYLDTVREGVTGVFFDDLSAEAIRAAVRRLRWTPWDAGRIRQHVDGFSERVFARRLHDEVARLGLPERIAA